MFDITFLGTSASVPSADRSHPGLLVEAGGRRIMVDCGEGTQRLLQCGAGFRRLHRLLLTHGHPGNQIKVALNPAVAEYFNERRARLENAVKHKLVITPDPTLPWEEYRILIE